MSPVNVSSIGTFIREQREQARISLRQLAQAAGMSNPYLSQIERGLRRPSADILQQIAKGLRISAEALYVQAGILEDRPAGPWSGRPSGRPGADRAAEAGPDRALRVIPQGDARPPTADAIGGRRRRRPAAPARPTLAWPEDVGPEALEAAGPGRSLASATPITSE